MIIHGLTVCVGYADFFAAGIARWRAGLASLIVVTTTDDTQTGALAARHGARLVTTDLFYRDGATFNKGRAMEHARRQMPWEDWILFFDSDVVPPSNWKAQLEASGMRPGSLYGGYRFDAPADAVDDRGQPRCAYDVPGVGYFQLFHVSDQVVQVSGDEPLIDTHWTHAGNYDNRFMDRWREAKQPIQPIPFRLAHVGERENWHGRGNRAAFLAMRAERKRRGGRWDHERIAEASA